MLLLAQDAAAQSGGLLNLLLLLALPVGLYFLMIRPQRRQAAERKALVESLKVGDDVVTVGGIHGTVEAAGDDTVDLLVTDDVVIRVARTAVGSVVTAGAQDDPLDDDLAAEDDTALPSDDDQA